MLPLQLSAQIVPDLLSKPPPLSPLTLEECVDAWYSSVPAVLQVLQCETPVLAACLLLLEGILTPHTLTVNKLTLPRLDVPAGCNAQQKGRDRDAVRCRRGASSISPTSGPLAWQHGNKRTYACPAQTCLLQHTNQVQPTWQFKGPLCVKYWQLGAYSAVADPPQQECLPLPHL